jgi:hypothetical protein
MIEPLRNGFYSLNLLSFVILSIIPSPARLFWLQFTDFSTVNSIVPILSIPEPSRNDLILIVFLEPYGFYSSDLFQSSPVIPTRPGFSFSAAFNRSDTFRLPNRSGMIFWFQFDGRTPPKWILFTEFTLVHDLFHHSTTVPDFLAIALPILL